jgi:hypothetical protein
LVTNENENGIKIIIARQQMEGEGEGEEKKTAKILRELVDKGDKAIEIANKIKEMRLTGIKKSIKSNVVREQPSVKKSVAVEDEYEKSEKRERKPKKTSVFQNIPTNAVYNLIDKNLMVGRKKLIDRIPFPPADSMKIPNYVMNNRLSFIRFANEMLFSKYKEQMEDENSKSKITCENLASGSATSGLMLHQQLVRDYLNLVTPYRGLLLYHGLGSGKTCSSIAIAEGMKDSKKVIIMLPASLQRNYIEEIKKCGDPIFKKNQYWEWVPVEPENDNLRQNLSMVLSLSPDYILKQKGAWITDVSKMANIAELTPEQLRSLNIQLDTMIRNKYTFINFNGLRKERFRSMTNNYTQNIFDNSVTVIDEAHNLISRIVNKISSLKDESKRSKKTLKRETVNRGIETSDELSLQIYHMLMMANNCKIVLLTGTPIINYPNEIGILFNILRGYIKTWTFKLRPSEGTSTIINEDMLKNVVFSKDKILDYLQYTPTAQRLVITRNPFGFESVIKESRFEDGKYVYDGISNVPTKKKDYDGRSYLKERRLVTDDEFQQKIIKLLRDNEISATLEGLKYNLALPDKLDEFLFNFIDINNPGKMKNEMKLKKRIMGLTSYFRSAQEELLPRYDKKIDKVIVKVNMSDFQFNIYSNYRKKERVADKKINNDKNNPNELFKQQSSTYRIMSRLACNLALPDRPNPMDYRKRKMIEEEPTTQMVPATEELKPQAQAQDEDEEEEMVIIKTKSKKPERTERIENTETIEKSKKPERTEKKSKKKSVGVTFAENDEVREITQSFSIPKSLMMSKTEEMLNESMSQLTSEKRDSILRSIDEFESTDFGKKYKFEKLPEDKQSVMMKQFKKYSSEIEKNKSLSFFDFFQSQLNKSKKGGGLFKLLMIGGLNSEEEREQEEQQEEQQEEEKEENNRTEDDIIIEELEFPHVEQEIDNITTANYKIDIANFMRNLKQNTNQFLSMTNLTDAEDSISPLMRYSPKYVEIIKNITSDEHLGLHLLYSQFRNMEGLDIFSMALNVNGFKRFEFYKNASGTLEVSSKTLEDDGLLCYAMYTGEESAEERELVRKIYNGDWNEIPQNIREQLQLKSPNNMMGEIIKLLMITSAGAEGINLRNTRYVHVMEPYWHPVRVEQVIGRARRICSHDKLPKELQTVQVFVYISVFTPQQLSSEFANEIKRFDKSSIEPFSPETSDEKLLQTSNIKEAISENILKSVKETSIDCATYSQTNEGKEGLKCVSFNSAKIDEFSYVPDYDEQQQDIDVPLGQIRKKVEFKKMTLRDGTQYMLKPDTNEIYDMIDIEQPNPTPVGKLISVFTVDEDGNQIPSGKSTIQFYTKASVIDESAR